MFFDYIQIGSLTFKQKQCVANWTSCYVACKFRTKGEIWHQFAKRKNNVSKEQYNGSIALKVQVKIIVKEMKVKVI
jgi:hypothetical protein